MPARAQAGVAAVGMALLLLVPWLSDLLDQPFYLDLFTRIVVFAIAALSLDLILGYGGILSFGHAVYLGIGGYAVGILDFYGLSNGFLQFAVAIAASTAVALLIGAVSLRTAGVYLIMITLAFGQMFYFLAISIQTFGGDDGLTIAHHSRFARLLDLEDPATLYFVCCLSLLAMLLLSLAIVSSRFGMVLRGLKSNEARMVALGYPVFRYKLAAFVISGAMCGFAGALLANQGMFVSPAIMHWSRSGEIMVMVILGGIGSLFGPVVGAVIYLVLEDTLSGLSNHWQLALGIIVLLVVLFAKRGLFGLAAQGRGARTRSHAPARNARARTPERPQTPRERTPPGQALLATHALVKRFGGLLATDQVDLEVRAGELHAVIGPNGAGKTTLIAQLAGDIPPDSGAIDFAGEPITGLPPYRRASRGLARSFQISSIFRDLTVLDNVALAVQARAGHSFRFLRPARSDARLREPATAFLAKVGLAGRAHQLAATLAHGEKRALEIAIVLATEPCLLLLDEPLAGMGPDDSAGMIALLSALKGSLGILLVEHDMDAVFALADRITVLVYGRVIASGAPADIRANEDVRRAYLGEATS